MIVIIAILASVAFPVPALVMEQARKAEAKNEVTNLVNAIKMYELEYGKLPFQAGEGGESDLEMDTFQDNIISVLAGYNVDGLNPRLKPFYEGKTAKILTHKNLLAACLVPMSNFSWLTLGERVLHNY